MDRRGFFRSLLRLCGLVVGGTAVAGKGVAKGATAAITFERSQFEVRYGRIEPSTLLGQEVYLVPDCEQMIVTWQEVSNG